MGGVTSESLPLFSPSHLTFGIGFPADSLGLKPITGGIITVDAGIRQLLPWNLEESPLRRSCALPKPNLLAILVRRVVKAICIIVVALRHDLLWGVSTAGGADLRRINCKWGSPGEMCNANRYLGTYQNFDGSSKQLSAAAISNQCPSEFWYYN